MTDEAMLKGFEVPGAVVQKYGGSSVRNDEKLREVARLVASRVASGQNVCVVVSAMGDTTDELLAQARRIHPAPPRRELDMLLSSGERISMALLAMALDQLGVSSMSLTGSQAGIITTHQHSNAQVLEVRPYRVLDGLREGKVVIVAGFQGVSYRKEVTTLGRGGSDTTAVALAAALGCDCEIYSDVDGVLSADPRVVDDTSIISHLSYDEMAALAEKGAKVLHHRCVSFAKERKVALFARRSGGAHPGTQVRLDRVHQENPVFAVTGIEHLEQWFKKLGSAGMDNACFEQVSAAGAFNAKYQTQADGAFLSFEVNAGNFTLSSDELKDEGWQRKPPLARVSVMIRRESPKTVSKVFEVCSELSHQVYSVREGKQSIDIDVEIQAFEPLIRQLHLVFELGHEPKGQP